MKRSATLALVLLVTLPAGAESLRLQCRRQCKATIAACADAGTPRAHCRREVLRMCRETGLVACGVTAPDPTLAALVDALPPVVNGCEAAKATDLTGRPELTVTFTSIEYSPPCFLVSAGTAVTFSGDFTEHPLVGGEVTMLNAKAPDLASPFMPTTTAGTSRTFTLTSPGAFSFYCDGDALIGMKGVAFVVP